MSKGYSLDEVIRGTANARKNGTYQRSHLQTNASTFKNKNGGTTTVKGQVKKDAHDDNRPY